MKINGFTQSIVYRLGALFLLIAGGVPATHAAPEVRFQLVRDALIIVPVTANDEGPLYFLLDTGAQTTIVDSGLAKRLALPALQTAQQGTVTGSQTVMVSRLGKLTLGDVHVDGLPVLEEDLAGLRRVDGRIVGIVGQDFLSHFNYLLDYRARSLRIEAGEELRDAMVGEPVPVEMGQNRMVLRAEARADARTAGQAKVRLLLDSGANALVLMGPASSAVRCPGVQPAAETSSAGAAGTQVGRVDLTVATREFHDLPVSLVAVAPAQATEDGLLPTALFEGLYVSNSEGFVIFNPRVKKTGR
jgi:hypothetical protein